MQEIIDSINRLVKLDLDKISKTVISLKDGPDIVGNKFEKITKDFFREDLGDLWKEVVFKHSFNKEIQDELLIKIRSKDCIDFSIPKIRQTIFGEEDGHRYLTADSLRMHQPFKMKTPDNLFFKNFDFLLLECKASVSGKIRFNNQAPKPGIHYIFGNVKRNQIIYSKGTGIEHPLLDSDPNIQELFKYREENTKKINEFLSGREYKYGDHLLGYCFDPKDNMVPTRELRRK